MLAFDRLDISYFANIHLDFVAKECEQVPRTSFPRISGSYTFHPRPTFYSSQHSWEQRQMRTESNEEVRRH